MLVDCVRASLNTSTGTQDITGDLSGNNPAAAILFLCGGTADGAHANDARISVGFVDGTSQYTNTMSMRHGVTTAETARYQSSNDCLVALDATTSTVEFEAEFDRWVADGIRINITNAPSSAYYVLAVFFSGEDVSAHVNTQLGGDQDVLLHVTDVGFQSDLIFFATVGTSMTAVTGNAKFCLGAATQTEQASLSTYSKHGDTTVVAGTICNSTRACAENDRNLDWALEIDNVDAAGFDMYSRDGNSGATIGYLALKFDNDSADITIIDTPTATGNDAQVVGLQPKLVMMLMSSCDAVDTIELGGDSGNIGVSMFDADSEYCCMVADDDGASTTNTSSMSDDTAVNFDSQTAANLMDASFVSMDATGFTLNYSNADGTARKWVAISIEGTNIQTIAIVSGNVTLDGYQPEVLKGSGAVVLEQGTANITGYAPLIPVIGATPIFSADITITGYAPKVSSGEDFVAKPKTQTLSISSDLVTVFPGPWSLINDSLPVGWVSLTDNCRS
jgi:hypothetical protein